MHTTLKVEIAQDMSHSSAEGKKLNMMKKEPERSNAVKVERSPMERRIVWNPQREVEPTLESLLAQMNDARVPTQAYGGIDDSRGVVGNTDGSAYGGVGGGEVLVELVWVLVETSLEALLEAQMEVLLEVLIEVLVEMLMEVLV